MIRRCFLDWRFHVGVALLACLVSALWGMWAVSGMALGLVGTFASVLGTWAAVQLLSNQEKEGPVLSPKKLILGFILLSKLPVFFACVMVASRLPDPGLAAFAGGLLSVYCLLVGWAQAQA